ncbi:MAG: TonB-dependent receptor [Candidatus Margulisiibacteriota bacterium]|nr:TonB-dependent receptor [Candidatus Margulisiibacteriota bacterium]
MLKKLSLALFIVAITFNVCFAERYGLEKIVITATKTEKEIKDVSATVSIITREDIEASNAKSCPDILNSLPGVFVNKTGVFGRADVDIRGLGERGRKVMILIDGRPVKMGIFGCTITHSLPLDNVERIEVVRGPNSVLYGSDALGGVINIITRKAQKDFEGNVLASSGTYNTSHYQVHVGGIRGKLDYFITADKQATDGYLPNSSFNGGNYTGRFGYAISDSLASVFTIKYFDGKKYEPLRSTDPPTPASTSWNDYKRGAIDLNFDGQWRGWSNKFKIYRNFGNHEFSDGWKSSDFTNGLMLHGTAGLLPGNELTLGAEYRQQGGEAISGATYPGNYEKAESAIFFHDEQRFLERLIVAFGARYNNDQVAGSLLCPQLGVVYHLPTDTTLRAAANRGFRAPQINELYLFPSRNPNLKAETVDNYELGIVQTLLPGVDFELVTFNMKGENLIELVRNATPPPMFSFQNTGSFFFKGTEISLKANPREWFSGRLSYSTLDPGSKTTGRPGKKIDISARVGDRKLSLSGNAQYVGDYYAADDKQSPITPFLVFNSKVNFEAVPGVFGFIAMDNMLNTDYVVYADLPGGSAGTYTMPGRTITAGLNYKF